MKTNSYNYYNSYIMSDETALGLLDADGSILLGTYKKTYPYLTYGLAEKGTRLYTKEQYLEWGLAWLKNPNRQKRKPRKT
jgi:hypothetical protein